MEEQLRQLFDSLGGESRVGSFESFKSVMSDRENRVNLFNQIKGQYEGNFEEFETSIGFAQPTPEVNVQGNLEKLYGDLGGDERLGSIERFSDAMSESTNRYNLYRQIKDTEKGTFEEFSESLGYSSKEPQEEETEDVASFDTDILSPERAKERAQSYLDQGVAPIINDKGEVEFTEIEGGTLGELEQDKYGYYMPIESFSKPGEWAVERWARGDQKIYLGPTEELSTVLNSLSEEDIKRGYESNGNFKQQFWNTNAFELYNTLGVKTAEEYSFVANQNDNLFVGRKALQNISERQSKLVEEASLRMREIAPAETDLLDDLSAKADMIEGRLNSPDITESERLDLEADLGIIKNTFEEIVTKPIQTEEGVVTLAQLPEFSQQFQSAELVNSVNARFQELYKGSNQEQMDLLAKRTLEESNDKLRKLYDKYGQVGYVAGQALNKGKTLWYGAMSTVAGLAGRLLREDYDLSDRDARQDVNWWNKTNVSGEDIALEGFTEAAMIYSTLAETAQGDRNTGGLRRNQYIINDNLTAVLDDDYNILSIEDNDGFNVMSDLSDEAVQAMQAEITRNKGAVEGDWSFWRGSSTAADVFLNLIPLFATTAGIRSGGRWVSKKMLEKKGLGKMSEALSGGLSMGAGVFVTTYPSYFISNLKEGVPVSKAEKLAIAQASVEAILTPLVGPVESKALRALTQAERISMKNAASAYLSGKITIGGLAQKWGKIGKGLSVDVLKELSEETLVQGGTDLVSVLGGIDSKSSFNEYLDVWFSTIGVSSFLGGMSRVPEIRESPTSASAFTSQIKGWSKTITKNLLKDVDKTSALIDEVGTAMGLSQEEINKKKSILFAAQQAQEDLDPSIPQSVRDTYLSNVVEHHILDDNLNNVQDELLRNSFSIASERLKLTNKILADNSLRTAYETLLGDKISDYDSAKKGDFSLKDLLANIEDGVEISSGVKKRALDHLKKVYERIGDSEKEPDFSPGQRFALTTVLQMMHQFIDTYDHSTAEPTRKTTQDSPVPKTRIIQKDDTLETPHEEGATISVNTSRRKENRKVELKTTKNGQESDGKRYRSLSDAVTELGETLTEDLEKYQGEEVILNSISDSPTQSVASFSIGTETVEIPLPNRHTSYLEQLKELEDNDSTKEDVKAPKANVSYYRKKLEEMGDQDYLVVEGDEAAKAKEAGLTITEDGISKSEIKQKLFDMGESYKTPPSDTSTKKPTTTEGETTETVQGTTPAEQAVSEIERRRQEELLIPQSLAKLPKYLAEGIKKAVEQLRINQRYEIVKQAILGKTAQQIVSELNLIDTDGKRNTEIVRQVRAYYGIPSQDTEGYQEWKNKVDKINAKYDAEYVDAVKKGEMTKEQAMQALEEIGRKNSSAYAEIAALEGSQQETTPTEQTQPDVEEDSEAPLTRPVDIPAPVEEPFSLTYRGINYTRNEQGEWLTPKGKTPSDQRVAALEEEYQKQQSEQVTTEEEFTEQEPPNVEDDTPAIADESDVSEDAESVDANAQTTPTESEEVFNDQAIDPKNISTLESGVQFLMSQGLTLEDAQALIEDLGGEEGFFDSLNSFINESEGLASLRGTGEPVWDQGLVDLYRLTQGDTMASVISRALIKKVSFKQVIDYLKGKGYDIEYTDAMREADKELNGRPPSYDHTDLAKARKEAAKKLGFKTDKEYLVTELEEAFPIKGPAAEIWKIIKPLAELLGLTASFDTNFLDEFTPGLFNPTTGWIKIDPLAKDIGRVLLEETIHALTAKVIDKVLTKKTDGLTDIQIQAVRDLQKMYNEVKNSKDFKGKYSVSNIYEFIGHLGDEEVRNNLIKRSIDFLQRIYDAILDILGIPANAYTYSKQILSDIVSNTRFFKEEGILAPGIKKNLHSHSPIIYRIPDTPYSIQDGLLHKDDKPSKISTAKFDYQELIRRDIAHQKKSVSKDSSEFKTLEQIERSAGKFFKENPDLNTNKINYDLSRNIRSEGSEGPYDYSSMSEQPTIPARSNKVTIEDGVEKTFQKKGDKWEKVNVVTSNEKTKQALDKAKKDVRKVSKSNKNVPGKMLATGREAMIANSSTPIPSYGLRSSGRPSFKTTYTTKADHKGFDLSIIDSVTAGEYEGDVNSETMLPEGYGKMIFPNGTYYEGMWYAGKPNGWGRKTTFKSNRVLNRRRSGKTEESEQREEVHTEGLFIQGKYIGNKAFDIVEDRKTTSKGYDILYSGTTNVLGKPHGWGIQKFYNKKGKLYAVYEGEFFNGKRSGKGAVTFLDDRPTEYQNSPLTLAKYNYDYLDSLNEYSRFNLEFKSGATEIKIVPKQVAARSKKTGKVYLKKGPDDLYILDTNTGVYDLIVDDEFETYVKRLTSPDFVSFGALEGEDKAEGYLTQSSDSGILRNHRVTWGTATPNKAGVNKSGVVVNTQRGEYFIVSPEQSKNSVFKLQGDSAPFAAQILTGKDPEIVLSEIVDLVLAEFPEKPGRGYEQRVQRLVDRIVEDYIPTDVRIDTVQGRKLVRELVVDIANRATSKQQLAVNHIKASKVGNNIYAVKMSGDVAMVLNDSEGNIISHYVGGGNPLTYSLSEGMPVLNTPKPRVLVVRVDKGQTLSILNNFANAESAINDFIATGNGKAMEFRDYLKQHKSTDAAFVSIDHEKPGEYRDYFPKDADRNYVIPPFYQTHYTITTRAKKGEEEMPSRNVPVYFAPEINEFVTIEPSDGRRTKVPKSRLKEVHDNAQTELYEADRRMRSLDSENDIDQIRANIIEELANIPEEEEVPPSSKTSTKYSFQLQYNGQLYEHNRKGDWFRLEGDTKTKVSKLIYPILNRHKIAEGMTTGKRAMRVNTKSSKYISGRGVIVQDQGGHVSFSDGVFDKSSLEGSGYAAVMYNDGNIMIHEGTFENGVLYEGTQIDIFPNGQAFATTVEAPKDDGDMGERISEFKDYSTETEESTDVEEGSDELSQDDLDIENQEIAEDTEEIMSAVFSGDIQSTTPEKDIPDTGAIPLNNLDPSNANKVRNLLHNFSKSLDKSINFTDWGRYEKFVADVKNRLSESLESLPVETKPSGKADANLLLGIFDVLSAKTSVKEFLSGRDIGIDDSTFYQEWRADRRSEKFERQDQAISEDEAIMQERQVELNNMFLDAMIGGNYDALNILIENFKNSGVPDVKLRLLKELPKLIDQNTVRENLEGALEKGNFFEMAMAGAFKSKCD